MVAALTLIVLAGVQQDLADATRLLKAAQEEAAVQVLTRSLDRPGLKPSERAELYLLLGIARLNLRDEEGAALAFARGIEADSSATLPPKIAPPRARELFEIARVEVARKTAAPAAVAEPAAPAPVAAVAVTEPDLPKPRVARWVGVAVGAVGVGVGAAGGYLLSNGTSLRAQSLSEPVAVTSAQLFDRAQSSWNIGFSLVGVGVAMLIAGIVTALVF